MPNKKSITIGNENYLVIDLTQPLRLDLAVYPGDPKPTRRIFAERKKNGWEHYTHEIGDHCFQPHGDAPKHYSDNNTGFEKFNLEYCFNKACMVDLSGSNSTILEVSRNHLREKEKLLKNVGALVIRTGYDRHLEGNKPHAKQIPHLSKEAAEYIASFKNIKVIGIDTLSVDPCGHQECHRLLKDKMIVESLVHLHLIPDRARTDFTLQTSPIIIHGATGGPVLAYAFVKQ